MTTDVEQPIATEPVSLVDALREQVKEEIGPEPIAKETETLVLQKFGLLPVRLSKAQHRVIGRVKRKEQHNGTR